MTSPIERAIAYLRANDVHDGLEGDLANDLEVLEEKLLNVLEDSSYALGKSAEFAGLIGEGDEEINAPWNCGGYGYEAHIEVMDVLDVMKGVRH